MKNGKYTTFHAPYFITAEREYNQTQRYSSQPQFHETNGEHSCSLALLRRRKIIDDLHLDVDYDKLDKMLMFHDFCEAGLESDYEMPDVELKNNAKIKEAIEKITINRISKLLDDPEIKLLWEEYHAGKTKEAIICKALDKITSLSHKISCGADPIIENVIKSITNPNSWVMKCGELIPFLAEFQQEAKKQFLEYGYKDKDGNAIEWDENWEIGNQHGNVKYIGTTEQRHLFDGGLGI
jgi:5'-deoxynucleotidase YfbR-like HD superfamily hydrolase